MKLIVLVFAALMLGACASAPPVAPERVARVQPLADDISCMADCLDDGSETCDSCAADCLEKASGAQVASGE